MRKNTNTDMNEMRRFRRFQKVKGRRLTQVGPAEMIGVTDRHVWGTLELVFASIISN
jgi:hypothetical protein